MAIVYELKLVEGAIQDELLTALERSLPGAKRAELPDAEDEFVFLLDADHLIAGGRYLASPDHLEVIGGSSFIANASVYFRLKKHDLATATRVLVGALAAVIPVIEADFVFYNTESASALLARIGGELFIGATDDARSFWDFDDLRALLPFGAQRRALSLE